MLPTVPLRAAKNSPLSTVTYARLERVRQLAHASQCRYTRSVECRRQGVRWGGLGHGDMPDELDRLLPRWWSRDHFLRSVAQMAEAPTVVELCRRHGVAPATWLAIVTNDALDAQDGGRRMSTTQTVAAARVQRSTKQVQRARRVAVEAGIYIEIYRARELSMTERIDLLRRRPGHKQRGLASVYALGIFPPKIRRRIAVPDFGRWAKVFPQAVTESTYSVHLPSLGKAALQLNFLDPTLLAADAAVEQEAAPPPAPKKHWKPRDGAFFARSVLSQRVLRPFLSACRPTNAAAMLLPHSRGGWTAEALAQALHAAAVERKLHTWEPARSPYGALKTLLTDIDIDARIHLTGRAFPDTSAPTPAPCNGVDHEPCGSPECDGYGWLLDDDPQAPVRPCPHCPPAIRAWPIISGSWDSDEPLF